jgi:hypothetical protein
MRATIRLGERLLTKAKIYTGEGARTLTALLEDALHESQARRREAGAREPIRLKTVKGNGLHDGIDLDNSASLLDLMER